MGNGEWEIEKWDFKLMRSKVKGKKRKKLSLCYTEITLREKYAMRDKMVVIRATYKFLF